LQRFGTDQFDLDENWSSYVVDSYRITTGLHFETGNHPLNGDKVSQSAGSGTFLPFGTTKSNVRLR